MCRYFGCCELGDKILRRSFCVVWTVFALPFRLLDFVVFVAPIHGMTVLLSIDWLGFISGMCVASLISYFIIIPVSSIYSGVSEGVCFSYIATIAWIIGHILVAVAIKMRWVDTMWKQDIPMGDSFIHRTTTLPLLTIYNTNSVGANVGALIGLAIAFPYAALRGRVTASGILEYEICEPALGLPIWVYGLVFTLIGGLNGIQGPHNRYSFYLSGSTCVDGGRQYNTHTSAGGGVGGGDTSSASEMASYMHVPHMSTDYTPVDIDEPQGEHNHDHDHVQPPDTYYSANPFRFGGPPTLHM